MEEQISEDGRNLSFVSFVSAILLGISWAGGNIGARPWAIFAVIVGFAMYARFLKFYGAYAAEVLRSFAYSK